MSIVNFDKLIINNFIILEGIALSKRKLIQGVPINGMC